MDLWDGWYVPDGDGYKPAPTDFNMTEYQKQHNDWIVGRMEVDKLNSDQPIVVSTVFLFLDHGWRDGSPILWETLVFDADDTPMADYQERYRSKRDAAIGHMRIVKACRDMWLAGEV